MVRFFSFLVLFAFAAGPQSVYSETTIYSIEIPGLHERNGGGDYDKIIDKALIKQGFATVKILPPAKAEYEFSKCTNCCFSPANKNPEFYEFGDDIVKTKPMGVAKIYIFTGKGKKIISNLSGLKGKKVGTRLGMPYGKTFDEAGFSVDAVPSIEQNIKKLDKGRIDAFIAYVPDAYDVFEKLGIPPYPHDVDNPIAVHEDCLVCREVPPDVIDAFNRDL